MYQNKQFKIFGHSSFSAGGFSYDKFLKAYKIQQTKFFFPYDYCTSLDVLNERFLSHKAFYGNLKENKHF